MLKLRPHPTAAHSAAARPGSSQASPVTGKNKMLRCPICKDAPLTEKTLEEGLPASNCGQCGGWWIDPAKYWQWIESRSGAAPTNPADIKIDPKNLASVKDSGPGKFCPGCGRFMARAKPGYGLNFFLSRCGGCGGIWLDAKEWENLRLAQLHDDIHRIFADTWQAEITRAERAAHHNQLLTEKLGADALAEIKRIKNWLENHPKKAELYAYLIEPKDSGPSKR